MSNVAFTIQQIVERGPLGRTTIFAAIKSGKLVARKHGRRTIVLDEDYQRFLRELPVVTPTLKAA